MEAGENFTSFQESESENFKILTSKLACMVYGDDEKFKTSLNHVLDQLNALEYSLQISSESDAYGALCQCCMLIPVKHEFLVTKACQLVVNLVSRQQLNLNQSTFDLLLEYLVDALQNCHPWALPEILRALGAVLYENGPKAHKFHDVLVGVNGILPQLSDTDVTDEDIRRGAVQCMENICMRSSGPDIMSDDVIKNCFQKFVNILHTLRNPKTDEVTFSRLLISALKGIHNTLLWHKSAHNDLLGELLAALKVYILYGISGQNLSIASRLYPSPSASCSEGVSPPSEKQPSTAQSTSQSKNQKRKVKKKRGKAKTKDGEEEEDQAADEESTTSDVLFLDNSWNKISSSESEVSDTEGGRASKLRSVEGKVRHTALVCLHILVKNVDRRTMSGYWSHFLPDSHSSSVVPSQTLFTIILKDPHVKARTGALAVLAALLDGSKPFLANAEDSNQSRAAFTPFSATLGATIKELHRCIQLALSSEHSSLILTQLIKCLSLLVQNTPYHRLKPGLLSRAVKQIKPFLNHRDLNVRVGCLTLLGAVVSVHSPLLEVCYIVQGRRPTAGDSISSTSSLHTPELCNNLGNNGCKDSEPASPIRSGSSTPHSISTLSDELTSSWVVKLCVKCADARNDTDTCKQYEPVPVKLEALQVLCNLVKCYFPSVRVDFALIRDTAINCLQDSEPPVCLHGSKLLEELGNVLLPPTAEQQNKHPSGIDKSEILGFWLHVFNGPIQGGLQNQTQHKLRATCIDFISTIGSDIFQLLPLDKRMLCITLLLGLTADDDKNVRSAALRALGVYILFPSLREDVSFVADVANTLLVAMEDENISVRVKAAWSLGNLSDAICANKDCADEDFIEDFSDMLLLRMVIVATKGSQDNDKVKYNAVRGLGNLLRYMPERCLAGKNNFEEAIAQAIQSLVKNVAAGTMKVRWNACYALGNMFKNPLLPLGKAPWTDSIYNTLCSVVKDCKNFKVKINASLSLSIPSQRCCYGNSDIYCKIWAALIDALVSSESIDDFAEFKYKNNLLEQACRSIVHLGTVLECEDLSTLSKILTNRQDNLLSYMKRYHQLLLTETVSKKVNELPLVCKRISELQAVEGQQTAHDVLSTLSTCFTHSKPAEIKNSGNSTFRQVYD